MKREPPTPDRPRHSGPSRREDEGVGEARRVVESIKGYLRGEGLGELETLAEVQSLWSDIVGEHVAAHAIPETLRGGELRVVVDQPAWATEFRFLAAQVISELQERLGNGRVSGIKVHVRA